MIVLLRAADGYWAKAEDIEGAVKKLRQHGARGMATAFVTVATGTPEQTSSVCVNRRGDIINEDGATLLHAGKARLSLVVKKKRK